MPGSSAALTIPAGVWRGPVETWAAPRPHRSQMSDGVGALDGGIPPHHGRPHSHHRPSDDSARWRTRRRARLCASPVTCRRARRCSSTPASGGPLGAAVSVGDPHRANATSRIVNTGPRSDDHAVPSHPGTCACLYGDPIDRAGPSLHVPLGRRRPRRVQIRGPHLTLVGEHLGLPLHRTRPPDRRLSFTSCRGRTPSASVTCSALAELSNSPTQPKRSTPAICPRSSKCRQKSPSTRATPGTTCRPVADAPVRCSTRTPTRRKCAHSSFVGREWLLGKARVGAGDLRTHRRQTPFLPGQPRARYCAPSSLKRRTVARLMASRSATSPHSKDSSGNAWAKVATIYYSPGLPIGVGA